jgi:hypothetical protein
MRAVGGLEEEKGVHRPQVEYRPAQVPLEGEEISDEERSDGYRGSKHV